MAWGHGRDALYAPLFVREETDLEELAWGPLSVHNLATYLPGLKGKKIGIVVKGCDSRSVVELLQENLINREDITIFGLHCSGVVDLSKIERLLGGYNRLESLDIKNKDVHIKADGTQYVFQTETVLADKCASCAYPDAVLSDHFIGQAGDPPIIERNGQKDTLQVLENMGFDERFQFWQEQMQRCIRCYACRSVCPLCVCRDHCAAQSRDPHWISQDDTPREKLMFQVMHAMHTAGRCTECGECERACPVDIPILVLKQKLNREIKRIFDYQAGLDPEATPPLFSFKEEEQNIKERSW